MPRDPSPDNGEQLKLPDIVPVLSLKETIVFPYVIVPLSDESEMNVLAIDQALGDDRLVMMVAQEDPAVEAPAPSELRSIGTVGLIMRMLKLPDGRVRVLVQGLSRARLENLSQTSPYLKGRIERLEGDEAPLPDLENQALVRNVRDHLEKAIHLGKNISPEVMVIAANLDDPGRLADLAASNLELSAEDAQSILETTDPLRRLSVVDEHLHREIDLLKMQHELSSQAQGEIDRSQREYFLRQQLKAIRQELDEGDELAEEIAGYRRLAKEKGLSEEADQELEKQIRRLERSHPESAENTAIRTYLDWLTSLPWDVMSPDNLDLDHAREVLDADHYGLEQVKQRIVEMLAVRKLKADARGPILCFVGPPGVGKTSLGRSIARALDRKFVRISLGGVRDEAEIRGHRRTYVGAMPGRIVQGIHQAETGNPVFMLDEIDKIGMDYRGDPSSALLEVLDPEQNFSFRDHYLGIPFDLSRVLFITTANLLDPIQPAFLDRMEVLRLSGYTEDDKLEIARRHLIPKQLEENGLSSDRLHFTKRGLQEIIRGHTREVGLRNLEREIGAICRKQAVHVARGRKNRVSIGPRRVEQLLGPEKHFSESLLDRDRIGVATGLAWTARGGDLLLIEAVAVPGKGKLLLTGQLGDVMKESGQAALSFARTFANELHSPRASGASVPRLRASGATGDLDEDFFSGHDIHVHAPAGSIPKDGPSAGITIATAIISMLIGVPVDRKVAMTGEITLRGDVLPIGGLKEKALAALAAGIETLILPKLNQRDLSRMPARLKKELDFLFVGHMDEVLARALVKKRLDEAATRE